MSDGFDKHFNRILLVAAASVFGGGAIRVGTDKLTDELAKMREVLAVYVAKTDVLERAKLDHEQRLTDIERHRTGTLR